MSRRSLAFVFLALLPLSLGYSSIQFNERYSRTIRRKDFYEITAGPHAYFVLYYIDDEPECRIFAQGWKDLAEDYADRDDIVLLQINCEYDWRLCRQQAALRYPYMRVYQNGDLYKVYQNIFFPELVREFIDTVSKDILTETVA